MNNHEPMIFLGTGAAELYPNPFCGCPVCERARREGAIPRKRSTFLLDKNNILDFGPDVLAASQQYNKPFSELDNIFITHTHNDHLCTTNIEVMTMTERERPINLYISEKGMEWFKRLIALEDLTYPHISGTTQLLRRNKLNLIPVKPYTEFSAGGYDIFTVESNHHGEGVNEFAVNYIFKRGDFSLMYVTDSGLYSEENLKILSGRNIKCLIMEGTNGNCTLSRYAGHLTAEHFVENVHNFRDYGVIAPDAEIYVTHINQVNTFSHEEYQEYLDKNCEMKVTVAYDGLII